MFIDEYHDYISRDANITGILKQARKQNVGLILTYQYLSQISQGVLENLFTNSSIKFVGGVSDRDAHAVARELRCPPAFLQRQPALPQRAFMRDPLYDPAVYQLTDNGITLLSAHALKVEQATWLKQNRYGAKCLAAHNLTIAMSYHQLRSPPKVQASGL